MKSPAVPRYLVPPRSKYTPQCLVLKHPRLSFFQQCQRLSFTPIQNNRQNYSLYILIFKFLDSYLEDKIFCTEWQQAFLDFSLLLIYSWIEFWFVKFVPKYNCISNKRLAGRDGNCQLFFLIISMYLLLQYINQVSQSHCRPEVPRVFQEVNVPRFHDNGTGWS